LPFPTYQNTTWGELKAFLALRLSDPNNIYWSDGELGLYLAETLRTFGLLTGFWRDTGVIQLSDDTPFYDLATIPLQNGDGTDLLTYTVTDQDIVRLIQYHLLEPSTGNSWTGSEQFTLSDLTQALNKRRDQLQSDTGCVITRSLVPTTPGDSSVFLSGLLIGLRRVAFVGSDNVAYPLVNTDILAQRNYQGVAFTDPGIPYSYSTASARPLELILIPPPNQPGQLDILSVQDGVVLDPTVGVAVGVPDDYTPAIKWGVMADILGKQGPAYDPIRAAYCERRFNLFVELIRMAPVVVNATINGIPLDTDSITNMDFYNQTWQTTTSLPDSMASMRSLIALAPCPNDEYAASLDVVTKAPIPAGIIAQTIDDDDEYVQIGKELLDAVLDYSEHLAAFKMGGEEFKATFRGADNFFDEAVNYNRRLVALNPNAKLLGQQSMADNEDKPQRVSSPGLGALEGNPVSGGSATVDQDNQTNPQDGQMG